MNLTPHELAYIAGFLEGDGSFQIMRYKPKNQNSYVYEYRISGYNTKAEVIKWLADKIGGYYASVKTSPRQKQPFHWNIKNQEAIELAEQLYPYTVAKREELLTWLTYAKDIIPNKTNKISEEQTGYRINLIKKIRHIRTDKNKVTKEDCVLFNKLPQSYPSNLDIAYLAGLIDAEGCFRLHKLIKKNRPNPTWATVIEIGNTNKLFFPWLRTLFGGNITYVKAKRTGCNNYAVWYIMSSQLRVILDQLVKYLIIKKPVCEKIIEFDKLIISNGGDRHSQAFKDAYKLNLARREEIFAEIQVLNTKGCH